jgi:hypothetical protein
VWRSAWARVHAPDRGRATGHRRRRPRRHAGVHRQEAHTRAGRAPGGAIPRRGPHARRAACGPQDVASRQIRRPRRPALRVLPFFADAYTAAVNEAYDEDGIGCPAYDDGFVSGLITLIYKGKPSAPLPPEAVSIYLFFFLGVFTL